MSLIKDAQQSVNFPPRRHGSIVLGNLCCGNGVLECVENLVVWDCKDHLFVVYKDGKVLFARTQGTRQ